MNKKLLVLALCACALTATAQSEVKNLRTENRVDPLGLDVLQPRFSWQLESGKRNVMQTAYEIRVVTNKSNVWSSGKVLSDSSVHVTYKGAALKSGEKYQWQVRVWDNSGKASAWSRTAGFQMALLQPSDWQASWITPGYEEDATMRPSPLMRKEFNIAKKIARATAYITAHGMYEAAVNGNRVGDAHFTPGWTSYKKRLQYQTYDVTRLLQQGHNALAVTLGSGWYRGTIGYTNHNNFYGKDIALLLQLQIDYTDGTKEVVVSDGSWKSSTGAITYSEIYNGETIDARKDKTGWMRAGYNDASWSAVKTASFDKANLLATYNEMISAQEVFKPVKVFKTPAGETVLDFGQNLVGWVRVKARGNAGDSIKLQHAEVLTKAGDFYTENLRAAKAQNIYVLKGGETETFHPHFTWQGFRYVKVEGYPGTVIPENFEAIAFYSDMEPTGTFTTSNPLINQLQHNIQWGQKGNFLDVPTDCPQRDERLGWTGDAQAFFRTASFNMGVNNFFTKWLKDLEADQIDGRVPHVIPNVLGNNANSAGWADVATIVPWQLYLAYGDKRTLAAQYNSMKNYVESVRKTTRNDLWNTGFHFGDWLFYRPGDDNDGRSAVTDKYLIAQCFYAHSVQLLINAATVLGYTSDAAAYTQLLQNVKAAFVKEYLTPSGRLVSSTQTAYVLALHFDMLPEALRKQAAERLVENIKSYNNHLTTGFLGTPYLCHVLTRFGYTDMAYTLLLQESYPSWLYPVKMGATTIWERWDGIKPDGSFQTPSMNSYNHYAYGAIGDWMYRKMVGLDTEEDGVGYKHIKVKPHIGGNFKQAAASLKTYYGLTKAGWEVTDGNIVMDVEVPANTRATVYLPVKDAGGVTESGKPLSSVKEIKELGSEDGYLKIETGSGKYRFTLPGK
ncbi:glycoside hydrolase family 78 protein [Niabella sp. CC-SYL272]|uniref:alpha-L-rhamnosidase n=1 Tax=Niabella agricola TaxID=2891571 RepID=UPI001F1F3B22|nr:alpha-L-rhamnosidase [Niabella agricola]MCF3110454.1 glycoside hydrolase family 78 protein [Niabella agricola]